MLARIRVLLSFDLVVPVSDNFAPVEYAIEGYVVRARKPECSSIPADSRAIKSASVNKRPAIRADVIVIDFLKTGFERKENSAWDPPLPIIQQAVNSLLGRIRSVVRAPQIHPVVFPGTNVSLQYLNDDESELEKQDGFVRGRAITSVPFSFVSLHDEVWHDVQRLPPQYEPPPWEPFLLDASAALDFNHTGQAIVLAATALEIFISHTLDKLAEKQGMSPDLWFWINERRREPSLVEQFDQLLKCFTGHSLKEEKNLWQLFSELRKARNSFVHTGTIVVDGKIVNQTMAVALVASASGIMNKVRVWLPLELHWSEFGHEIQLEIEKGVGFQF